MLVDSRFLMMTCQHGAEAAVKAELAREHPTWHMAYSRPGFLTFKLPELHGLSDEFTVSSVFARSQSFSLGKPTGALAADRAREAWKLVPQRDFDCLHVWPRDLRPAGDHGYDPGLTPECEAVARELIAAAPANTLPPNIQPNVPARPGQMVLDCVLVGPDEWWMGYHRAGSWRSRQPGGLAADGLSPHAVSRAYLKLQESLAWSGLPLEAGQRAVELGGAPGGSCQVLLERGLEVIGVDPAEMHADLMANPKFTHWRKRVADIRRREFRKTHWLAADMNVAPNYTLDAVESIVMHPQVRIRGLLLTLKLSSWKLAEEVPQYLERVREWGFPYVHCAQLQHHRQEICVAAQRKLPTKRGGAARTRTGRTRSLREAATWRAS